MLSELLTAIRDGGGEVAALVSGIYIIGKLGFKYLPELVAMFAPSETTRNQATKVLELRKQKKP